jgi:hypothetical protein
MTINQALDKLYLVDTNNLSKNELVELKSIKVKLLNTKIKLGGRSKVDTEILNLINKLNKLEQ